MTALVPLLGVCLLPEKQLGVEGIVLPLRAVKASEVLAMHQTFLLKFHA